MCYASDSSTINGGKVTQSAVGFAPDPGVARVPGRIASQTLILPSFHDPDRMAWLLEAFLTGRNPRTVDAYRRDLEDFRSFSGAPTLADAVRGLLGQGQGQANGVAWRYRAHLLEKGMTPATINRRLAALRSMVKLARTLGLVHWTVDVESVKRFPYRDTRGAGRENIRRLFEEARRAQDHMAARDFAILHLLYDLGLRRGEVVELDLLDVDQEGSGLAVAEDSLQGRGDRRWTVSRFQEDGGPENGRDRCAGAGRDMVSGHGRAQFRAQSRHNRRLDLRFR